MLRSSAFARASCAATMRRRDARSSSISRTLRSTSPACEATSRSRRSFAGSIGSLAGIVTDSAPRSSPRCRTSTADCPGANDAAPGDSPHSPAAAVELSAGEAPSPDGHDAATRRSPPRTSHTRAEEAPVPAARIRAISGRTASVE
jgi:hypothetical protein